VEKATGSGGKTLSGSVEQVKRNEWGILIGIGGTSFSEWVGQVIGIRKLADALVKERVCKIIVVVGYFTVFSPVIGADFVEVNANRLQKRLPNLYILICHFDLLSYIFDFFVDSTFLRKNQNF
jgi:hypothetical protein